MTPSTRKGGTGFSQVAFGERDVSTAGASQLSAQAGTTPASVPRACSRAVRVRGICRRDVRRIPSTRELSSGQKKQVGSALPDPTRWVYLETVAPPGRAAVGPGCEQACTLPTATAIPVHRAVRAGSLSQGPGWVPQWTFVDGSCPHPRPPPPLLLVLTLPSCWEAPSGETVLVGTDAGRQSASPGGRGGLALSLGPGAGTQSPGDAGDHG